jgi:hypothetical protein
MVQLASDRSANMSNDMWRGIQEARRIATILVALVFVAGCGPRHVRWRDSDPTILPQGARVDAQLPPHGYLVMEKVPPQKPGAEQMERYPPIYLYDQQGTFIGQLANNTEFPKPLRAGDYIVLVGEADPLGPFRQVQVRIEDGRTTTVSLADIGQAPWR